MTSPFLAEVRIFSFNFPPKGWAFCDGAILPLSQYTALFSLLGTNFGGNGQSNFGLPNCQGNVVVNPGQGQGLSDYVVGQTGGTPSVTLQQSQMPSHNHRAMAVPANGDQTIPTNHSIGQGSNRSSLMYVTEPKTTGEMPVLAPVGPNPPHNNMMPTLSLNFCIALQGIYPPRG